MTTKTISNIQNMHLSLVIKVVENEEEKLKAMLIRGIVYMHEQSCPYQEEFDLNDFAATQIIGLMGIPDHRDRSFRCIVTVHSGSS